MERKLLFIVLSFNQLALIESISEPPDLRNLGNIMKKIITFMDTGSEFTTRVNLAFFKGVYLVSI